MYVCMYVYIYIYIERERERERESFAERVESSAGTLRKNAGLKSNPQQAAQT